MIKLLFINNLPRKFRLPNFPWIPMDQASVPSHLDRLWQCPSRRVVSEERRADTSPSLAASRFAVRNQSIEGSHG